MTPSPDVALSCLYVVLDFKREVKVGGSVIGLKPLIRKTRLWLMGPQHLQLLHPEAHGPGHPRPSRVYLCCGLSEEMAPVGPMTLEKGRLESLGVSCTLKNGLDFHRKRECDLKAAGHYKRIPETELGPPVKFKLHLSL